jgi:phage major head subunit gpT-like protein
VYSSAVGTYCNKFNAGGQTIGGILIGGTMSPVSVSTVANYAPTIAGEDGEALGITYNRMMIPAALQVEAQLVCKALSFAPATWGVFTGQVGAADNPLLQYGIEPVVNPLLDGQSKTNFYMFDNTKAIKPMVWQVNTAPVFAPRVSETDPNVWDRHKYQWGAWGRVAPAWSYSYLMSIVGT